MKFDQHNHYWLFKPRLWYGMSFIEVALKKLFSSQIDTKFQKLFDDVETYLMFIGYPRSGHSLIGSILDAHPDAIISHELDVLKFIKAGFTKKQIFYLILKNSNAFTKGGRKWFEYSYKVPNQWNGEFRRLKAIGDKKGGRSTRRFSENPKLMDDFYRTINTKKIKFIHVFRNPYDNITSILKNSLNNRLIKSIDFYFYLCKSNEDIKNQIKNIIDIRFESLISDPKNYFKKICEFLDLDVSADYLDDCSSIVFKSPRKRRFDIHWSSEYIDIVKNKMKEFDFLKGYSFQE